MRARRRVLLLVGAVTAAAIVTAGVWWWLARPAPGPEETALGYFHALATGDPAAVRASGLEVDEAAATAYASAFGTVSDPTVTDVDPHADTARVTVSFRLDGAEHRTIVAMIERDGRWHASSPITGTLTVARPWGEAAVGGTPIGAGPLPLLPAVYEVRAAPMELVTGSAEAVVLPGEEADAALAPALTERAAAEAQARLEDRLRQCAEPASAVPEHCGMRVPWAADLATIDRVLFRIEKMPTVALDPPSFAATGGALVATVTGADHAGAPAAATYRTDSWGVRGDLRFDDDRLLLAVR
ncbi:hypothetical protein J2Y69_000204 [Microbacterium resistens]|uniref:NTF2-like N-terminal transpeptidase domain-containing protein n=1 Tax=Microbacterium resistens TaxID=156977 RepID=A0ABU1S7N1_9MICO|nr:hypothetical protein [Microbacterium resistens]MDR6865622.1 hypothetical protein [Microbacterium resistens]